MRKFFERNATRIAVIAISILFASTSAASVALAALSANYSWSDTMQAGDFDFSDSSQTFDLFEDEVFPGDGGNTTLETPNFGTNNVRWSFSETNANSMPVVFYTLNEGIPSNLYSKYDFAANLASYYVSLPTADSSEYTVCDTITTEPTAIAAGLDTGETLYWSWPLTIYSDTNGTVATGASVTDYDIYCTNLCVATYEINNNVLRGLDGSQSTTKPLIYANGYNSGFVGLDLGSDTPTASNGLLKIGENFVQVYNGTTFREVTLDSKLTANDFYVAFVFASEIDAYLLNINYAGVTGITRLDNNLYKKSGGVHVVDASGSRVALKIAPIKINEKATISVTVTATVTQA